MFHWYEQESGQAIEPAVIERIYTELRGQPGLTSWFGELLTETYNKQNPIITLRDFEVVEATASSLLPNANIINMISKANEQPHRDLIIELFQTEEKVAFKYDDPSINFLYMNGVIDEEAVGETQFYVRFPCPFVQKRLFNHFAREIFRDSGTLYLQIATITVVFFVEAVDDTNRARYEVPYHDAANGITVEPLLVTTVE